MTRFCYRCGDPITDEKRIMRGGLYCADKPCKREANKEIRRRLAEKFCRLCKRPPSKRKVSTPTKDAAAISSPCAPVAQVTQ